MNRFEDLVGKTLTNIEVSKDEDEIIFTLDNGKKYKLYHSQECCESVYIEDIGGDLINLVGYPITMAEESTNSNECRMIEEDSFTYTFYKLATVKGYVTIRWVGGSNGYYSESVDWDEVDMSQ